MAMIKFKVAYLFPGTSPRPLELKKVDKNGNVQFINNVGALISREPQPGEEPYKLTLFTTEDYEWQGEKVKRVVGMFSYYLPEEAGHIEGSTDISMNQIIYEAHRMLKTHQNVAVKDVNGNDINPNRYGAVVKFELIEESQLIQNQVDKNEKIALAQAEITEMFKTDKEGFIDFCYAYGIRPVMNVPVQNLYNEAMLKIQINPTHYFVTKELKDRDILVLVKKAMEIPVSEDSIGVPKTLISVTGDKYYMDGEIIANTELELVNYFKTHPKQKDYVMTKIGVKPETEFPVVEINTQQPPIQSQQKSDFDKKAHQERITKMVAAINFSFTKYKKGVDKNPENKGKLLQELDENLARKREGFIDVMEAFDEKVANDKKYIK